MIQKNNKSSQIDHASYSIEEEIISPLDILLIVARHLKIIIIIPVIFCIYTIFYVLFFTSPIYVSKATFMSSNSGGNKSTQMMGLAAQFGFSMPNNDVTIDYHFGWV